MKTIEIVGYQRKKLGKSEAKRIRHEANVPCVLYGGNGQVHFYAPMILFRDLVYTPNAYKVNLNIEGKVHNAILQEVQFHPVSEVLLHADFLELTPGKEVKMNIPVRLTGTSPAELEGGSVYLKNKKLMVKALPENLPDHIDVDISHLKLGHAVRVGDLSPEDYIILTNQKVSIAIITVPRALKKLEEEEAAAAEAAALEAEEGVEGAEAAEVKEGDAEDKEKGESKEAKDDKGKGSEEDKGKGKGKDSKQ